MIGRAPIDESEGGSVMFRFPGPEGSDLGDLPVQMSEPGLGGDSEN
jgi:hypothetical protein